MTFRPVPLLALSILSLPLTAPAHADLIWETNYDVARAKSQQTGKPLFVDVYTDWCGWCKKLDNAVYPDPRVQQLAKNFVMLRLNAEVEGVAFACAMRIQGYPTLFLATAKGAQVARRGYVESDELIRLMMQTLRFNGAPRPLNALSKTSRTANKPKTASTKSVSTPKSVGRPKDWQSLPELRRVVQSSNYGGALQLGDGGVVAIDNPTKKTKSAQTSRNRTATKR